MRCFASVFVIAVACQSTSDGASTEPYTVVKGDTLFLIAKRHGTTVDALRAANRLEGDLIEVGQQLWLPEGYTTKPLPEAHSSKAASPARVAKSAEQLTMPEAEPCLTGPSGVAEEHGMAASEGISRDTARRVLGAHVQNALPCFRGYPELERGTATLDLHVACTGVVTRVQLAELGDWPQPIGACLAEKMRYADFPAHALPDGDVVRYPLTYTPPEP